MIKNCVCLALFLVFIFLPCWSLSVEHNRPGLSLKETFDIYVKAVQNSDLKTLFTTVTSNENFFFLTTKGKLIDSRQGYYKFHENWFKEKDWQMPVDFLEAHEGKEYGFTNAIFHYRSKLPEGGMYFLDSYFTLIFRKEEGMWKVVADICTPISRSFSEADQAVKYTSDQEYLFNIIKNRRTVRKFKPTPIPKEHILKILDAAHFAPTAGNQQSWKFLVIQDRDKLDKLQEEALSWYLKKYKKMRSPTAEELSKTSQNLKQILANVLSAPVYVAVLVDAKSKYPDYVIYDGTLAAGYLVIAARALGYGTGFFTTFFPEREMKKFFDIPQNYRLICFTPIGVPYEWPQTPDKKKLEDLIIFESF